MAGHPCPGPLVWEMLAADLSPGEWRSLERHLRMCPRCMEALATGRPGVQPSPAERAAQPADPLEADPGFGQSARVQESPAEYAATTDESLAADSGAVNTTGSDASASVASGHLAPAATQQAAPGTIVAEEALGSAGSSSSSGASGRGRTVAFVAAAVALALLFALAPVRSAAAGLLAQFRVREVRAVAVDPADLENLDAFSAALDEVITLETVNGAAVADGKLDSMGPPSVPQAVGDWDEASLYLDFAPRMPADLGEPARLEVAPGGDYHFRVDGKRVLELAEAAGLPTDGLPDSVGYVDVSAEPGVIAEYRSTEGPITFHQAPVPDIRVPSDWDLEALGQLYLGALGASAHEARALASTIDWGSTLVVPFPAGEAEAIDVRVDGVDGVAFIERSWGAQKLKGERRGVEPPSEGTTNEFGASAPEDEPQAVVVWEKDGMLYAIAGDLDPTGLVAIAEDLS